jgi:hypothetical protein
VRGVVNAVASEAAVDTSQAMDDEERRHWRARWRQTVWQLGQPDGGWRGPLIDQIGGQEPRFALSAWNPRSLRLPTVVNRARDALLEDELRSRGERPQRVRGGDSQAGWWEEGWLVGHEAARDAALLRRYGQLAGLVLGGGSARLLWSDGVCDPA